MKNILLLFCRESRKYNLKKIATHLGLSIRKYKELETGKILLTKEQARQLGKLFKVNGDYFYDAALQLELLLTQREMIISLKERNKRLEEQLKKQNGKGHIDRQRK